MIANFYCKTQIFNIITFCLTFCLTKVILRCQKLTRAEEVRRITVNWLWPHSTVKLISFTNMPHTVARPAGTGNTAHQITINVEETCYIMLWSHLCGLSKLRTDLLILFDWWNREIFICWGFSMMFSIASTARWWGRLEGRKTVKKSWNWTKVSHLLVPSKLDLTLVFVIQLIQFMLGLEKDRDAWLVIFLKFLSTLYSGTDSVRYQPRLIGGNVVFLLGGSL